MSLDHLDMSRSKTNEPSILENLDEEDITQITSAIEEFSKEKVTAYLINGHGSEYPVKSSKGFESFILPSNCTVVTAMQAGKRVYQITDPAHLKRVNSLCTIKRSVMNGFRYDRQEFKKTLKKEKRVDVIDTVLNQDCEIMRNFGPVTIIRGGERCPNFYYTLISTVKNKTKPPIFHFMSHGSGVTDITKFHTSNPCLGKKITGKSATIKHNYTQSDTEDMIIEKTIKVLKTIYENSSYPTSSQVQSAIISFNSKKLPDIRSKLMINGKMSGKLYLSHLIHYFKNTLHQIFKISQQELCRRVADGNPGKTFIFFNFVCRSTPYTKKYFEINESTRKNSLIKEPKWKNYELKKLLCSAIGNSLKRRTLVKAGLNSNPRYNIVTDPLLQEEQYRSLKEIIEKIMNDNDNYTFYNENENEYYNVNAYN
jgi:hypothetical protein